jgi:hypothetical protein
MADLCGWLSALAQFFEARYKYAFTLCERGEREKAEALSHEMSMEPALEKLHHAGCHSILAYASTRPCKYKAHYVDHVRR